MSLSSNYFGNPNLSSYFSGNFYNSTNTVNNLYPSSNNVINVNNSLNISSYITGIDKTTDYYFIQYNYSTTQSLSSSASSVVSFNTLVSNNCNASVDLTNFTITLPISGTWQLSFNTQFIIASATNQYIGFKQCIGAIPTTTDPVLNLRNLSNTSTCSDGIIYIGNFFNGNKVYAFIFTNGTTPSIGSTGSSTSYNKSLLSCQFLGS